MEESELVKLAQDGDSAAAEKLLEKCTPTIKKMLYVKFHPLTDEKLQVCLTKIYENIDNYDDIGYQFSMWAKRVARNEMYDYHRKKAQREHPLQSLNLETNGFGRPLKDILAYSNGSPYPDLDWAETPETILENRDMMEYLDNLLHRIEDEHPNYFPETIRLKIKDYSYEEISTMMDIPIGTVKSQIHRLQKKMSDLVQTNPEYEEMASILGK